MLMDKMMDAVEREKDAVPPPIDFSKHPAYLDTRTPPFPHSPPPGTHSPSDLMNSGQGHHWTFVQEMQSIRTSALEVTNFMFQARMHEKDFLLHRDPELIERVTEEVNRSIDKLKSIEELSPDETLSQKANQAQLLLQGYHEAFLEVVQLWKERGLSETEGAQGEFRKVAAEMEKLFNEQNREDLITSMLRIQRNEKDYLLSGNKQYSYQTADLVEEMQNQIRKSDISMEVRRKLFRLTNDYIDTFDSLVYVTGRIDGRTQVFQITVEDVNPFLQEIIDLTKERLAETIQHTQQIKATSLQSILIVGGTILAILIFVGWRLERSITVPLYSLVKAIEVIAKGDFTGHVVSKGSGELRQLSMAMNRLITVIGGIMRNIAKSTDKIDTEHETLSQAIETLVKEVHQLNHTATTQSATIEETSSAARQIKDSVERTEDFSRTADQLAHDAEKESKEGAPSSERNDQQYATYWRYRITNQQFHFRN